MVTDWYLTHRFSQCKQTLDLFRIVFLHGSGNQAFFFSIWVLFHEHSRFIGEQGKGEVISLTPLCHFHPSHRHLDISRANTVESLPLHLTNSQIRTGNLWFPSASRLPTNWQLMCLVECEISCKENIRKQLAHCFLRWFLRMEMFCYFRCYEVIAV